MPAICLGDLLGGSCESMASLALGIPNWFFDFLLVDELLKRCSKLACVGRHFCAVVYDYFLRSSSG